METYLKINLDYINSKNIVTMDALEKGHYYYHIILTTCIFMWFEK
jgi:hypothetical protein